MLTVGNLNPLKGADLLLAGLASVEGPCVLKVVGMQLATHQAYAQSLHSTAASLASAGIQKVVQILGWRSPEEVRILLAGCDVFVMPSRSEACPIALLEAMSMGCYCIVANVGDVLQMISGYDASSVFIAGDRSDLERKLEALKLPMLDGEAATARRRFRANQARSNGTYTLESMKHSYQQMYEGLLRLKGSQSGCDKGSGP